VRREQNGDYIYKQDLHFNKKDKTGKLKYAAGLQEDNEK